MRYIIGFGLCLILTSCWKNSDDIATGPTACPYEAPTSIPTYKLSTYPDTMNTGIDQEKLTRFMSLATSETSCYLSSNGAISLSKISGGDGEANEAFANFPIATAEVEQNWLRFSDDFKNDMMGLTTIRFSGGAANEKIVAMSITIRDDANLWHLWHEYSHALIGQARAANKNQNLYIPSEEFIDQQLEKLEALDPQSDAYTTALQSLIQNYRDHMDKTYLDEILIEATLIDLTIQNKEPLNMRNEDYLRSMGAIDFFMKRYNRHFKATRRRLNELLKVNDGIATNKMILSRAILYFSDQHRRIHQITETATSEIELQ